MGLKIPLEEKILIFFLAKHLQRDYTIDYHVKVNGQWRTTKTTSKQLEGNEEGKCKVKRIREENHPGFQISPWGDGLCGAQNCKK